MSDNCGSERPGDGVPSYALLASRHVAHVSVSVLFLDMWQRAGFSIFRIV